MKNYLIGIDGTICEDIPNEEFHRMRDAIPLPGAKEQINKLYDEGNTITFFTGRVAHLHQYITEQWLHEHGFKYHKLIMDKPRHGNYIWLDNLDVKSIKFNGEWNDTTLYPVNIWLKILSKIKLLFHSK